MSQGVLEREPGQEAKRPLHLHGASLRSKSTSFRFQLLTSGKITLSNYRPVLGGQRYFHPLMRRQNSIPPRGKNAHTNAKSTEFRRAGTEPHLTTSLVSKDWISWGPERYRACSSTAKGVVSQLCRVLGHPA